MRVARTGGSMAWCEDGQGDGHEVAIELVMPVEVGDAVLVHAGVAIAQLGATL
jgi:hydrogenase maturation factor